MMIELILSEAARVFLTTEEKEVRHRGALFIIAYHKKIV
jgi:hypothetical protein